MKSAFHTDADQTSEEPLHLLWRAQQHLLMHDPYPRRVRAGDLDAIEILRISENQIRRELRNYHPQNVVAIHRSKGND